MKKRRCDFMTVTEIQKAFNEHCMNNECNHCKYSPTNCNFSFALDEVEVFSIKEWALKYFSVYEKREAKGEVKCHITQNSVVVFVKIPHSEICKIGYSICRKEDRFIVEIGIAIAYCRAMGYEIPKEIYQ